MRIVITGATGNVGSAVVRALEADERVREIVGVARRSPSPDKPADQHKTRYVAADIVTTELKPIFAGADAVIHLAWAIQPSRDRAQTRAINVEGTRRVLDAVADAGVQTVVHASSVGAYSPHPGNDPVDESFPTDGIRSSFYSVDKADAERLLTVWEAVHPQVRSVRLRPGLIFQRSAAAEIRRLFLGPLFPGAIVRPGLIPVLPRIPGVRFQGVHSDDVAQAYLLAVMDDDACGAYNVAAPPVLDLEAIAALLGARTVSVPFAAVRAAADISWRARLQPTPAGWLDIAAQAPLMDCDRARDELHWTPRQTGSEALAELLDGLRHGTGAPTPPLAAHAGGPLRIGELLSGLGRRGPRVSASG